MSPARAAADGDRSALWRWPAQGRVGPDHLAAGHDPGPRGCGTGDDGFHAAVVVPPGSHARILLAQRLPHFVSASCSRPPPLAARGRNVGDLRRGRRPHDALDLRGQRLEGVALLVFVMSAYRMCRARRSRWPRHVSAMSALTPARDNNVLADPSQVVNSSSR